MTDRQVALVTGTSSGIGLSSAVALAESGFQVVATMRNLTKADALRAAAEAANVDIDIQVLDVEDDDSASHAVDYTLSTYGRIDVLVNNAGAGYGGTTEQTSIKDLRNVLEVNFVGVWRMTRAVLPHMREAKSGRIISVSSIGGLIGQPFNDAYCAAKFAVEGMMESLAPVLRGIGIHVSVIEPGPVLTQFIANLGGLALRSEEELAIDPYADPLNKYLIAVRGRFNDVGQTGEDIAQIIVEAATAEQPNFRYQTSDAVRGMTGMKFVDPTGNAQITMVAGSLKSE